MVFSGEASCCCYGGILMAQKVFKAGVKREAGYLYYVDKKGDVARTEMARGGSGSKSEAANFSRERNQKRVWLSILH